MAEWTREQMMNAGMGTLREALEAAAARMQEATRNAAPVIVSSNPGFVEAYRNAAALTRVDRAKQRVAVWFDRQTAAGIAVDLGLLR